MRVVALLFGCVAVLAAAEAPPERAAFVSRLQAQPEERSVVLTWRNPANAPNRKLVYRSAEPIRAETLPAAVVVARLGAEVERYEDTPPDGQSYFYAVLLEDPEGKPVDLLLPLRNKTTQGVRISAAPPEEAPATEITAPQAEPASPPRLALPAAPAKRPLPLPTLRLPEQPARPRAEPTPPAQPVALRAATLQRLRRLLPAAGPEQGEREVQIVEEHLRQSPGLEELLRQRLQAGAYTEAETALREMLTVESSQASEAPLRFYLGQSLYKQGLYAEAALEFVLARDWMYRSVQPWLEDSLRRLSVR